MSLVSKFSNTSYFQDQELIKVVQEFNLFLTERVIFAQYSINNHQAKHHKSDMSILALPTTNWKMADVNQDVQDSLVKELGFIRSSLVF